MPTTSNITHPTLRTTRAFALVELLVVVSIISLLMAILLPALQRAKEAARHVHCMSNIRQVGLITQTYVNDFGGQFPPFFYSFSPGNSGNLVVLIVPRKAAAAGFDQYHDGILVCPSDLEPGTVPVQEPDNTIVRHPVSYGLNLDLLVKGTRQPNLYHPASVALMFDGSMSGAGQGGHNIQGSYRGSREFIARSMILRHFQRKANVVFVDWHVESLGMLTDCMIADNCMPYERQTGGPN